MASGWYQAGMKSMVDGTVSYTGDTIKCLAVGTGYTFNPDAVYVDEGGGSDVLDGELSGTGYAGGYGGAGRKTLSTKSIAVDNTNNKVLFHADDLTWTSINAGTIGGFVIFKQGASDDTTARLIAFIDVTDTATSGGNVTLDFSATNGMLAIACG